jgi:WD40 repeat protein
LASGSVDQTLRLWGVGSGRVSPVPSLGHAEGVRCVAFGCNSRGVAVIVSCSVDRTLRLWDAASGRPLGPPLRHAAAVQCVTFVPPAGGWDLGLAAGCVDGTIHLWDVVEGRQGSPRFPKPLAAHVGAVNSVAVCTARGDGALVLVSASHDKTIRLWDPVSGLALRTEAGGEVPPLLGHTDYVRCVCAGGPGAGGPNLLATSSDDASVRVWDVDRGHAVHVLHGYAGWVRSVAMAHGGTWGPGAPEPQAPRVLLASGSENRTVRLWSVERGLQLGPALLGHEGAVHTVALRWRRRDEAGVDHFLLASGSVDKTVRVWEVALSRDGSSVQALRVAVLTGHALPVTCVAFGSLPDTHGVGAVVLASGSDDGTVRLWEVPAGRLLWASRSQRQALDVKGTRLANLRCLTLPLVSLLSHHGVAKAKVSARLQVAGVTTLDARPVHRTIPSHLICTH